MNLLKTHRITAAAFAAIALLALSSCDLGTPIKASPTEVEGLTGTLVGPNGAPVSGAWVKVYPASGATAKTSAGAAIAATTGPALDSVQTDMNGKFILKGLADGTYNLAAQASRNDTALALFLRNVIVAGGTKLTLDTLKVAGSVKLQVTAQGGVLSGSQCVISASPWVATTDSLGYCVIKGLPAGEFQITLSYNGALGAVLKTVLVTPGDTLRDTSGITLPPSSVPVLSSPAANATNVTASSVTFIWTGVISANFYRLQVATDSVFTHRVVEDTVPASVIAGPMSRTTSGFLPSTNYFWRVIASQDGQSAASGVRRFTTVSSSDTTQAPTAPILLGPGDSSMSVVATPSLTFAWSKVTAATNYQIQVSASASFSTFVLNDSTPESILKTTSLPLSAGVAYYWHVRALVGGTWGPWSVTWRFGTSASTPTSPPETTVTALSAPTLTTPTANSTVTYGTNLFQWNTVEGATGYWLQIAKDSTFLTKVADTLTSDTTRQVVLEAGTTYYWRVRATNNVLGVGPYSAPRKLTTTTPAPSGTIVAETLYVARDVGVDQDRANLGLGSDVRLLYKEAAILLDFPTLDTAVSGKQVSKVELILNAFAHDAPNPDVQLVRVPDADAGRWTEGTGHWYYFGGQKVNGYETSYSLYPEYVPPSGTTNPTSPAVDSSTFALAQEIWNADSTRTVARWQGTVPLTPGVYPLLSNTTEMRFDITTLAGQPGWRRTLALRQTPTTPVSLIHMYSKDHMGPSYGARIVVTYVSPVVIVNPGNPNPLP